MTVASSVSLPTQPLASTYDEAACAAAAHDEAMLALGEELPVAAGEHACSEPQPVAVPLVIDCSDPGMSVWISEMIGSCEIARPKANAFPSAWRSNRAVPSTRICDGLRCSHESVPLRAAYHGGDVGAFAIVTRIGFGYFVSSATLSPEPSLAPPEPALRRLERPPRRG